MDAMDGDCQTETVVVPLHIWGAVGEGGAAMGLLCTIARNRSLRPMFLCQLCLFSTQGATRFNNISTEIQQTFGLMLKKASKDI